MSKTKIKIKLNEICNAIFQGQFLHKNHTLQNEKHIKPNYHKTISEMTGHENQSL